MGAKHRCKFCNTEIDLIGLELAIESPPPGGILNTMIF